MELRMDNGIPLLLQGMEYDRPFIQINFDAVLLGECEQAPH